MIQITVDQEQLRAMIVEHVRKTEGIVISDPERLSLSVDMNAYDSHNELLVTATLQPRP